MTSDELQDPRHSPICLGHNDVEQKVLSLIQGNTLPHGLMFTGVKGIGKATFAHRLAKFLLIHGKTKQDSAPSMFGDDLPAHFPETMDVDHELTDIRLYLNNAHPDCKVVERLYDDSKNTFKPSVEVDEVRKVIPFLRMSAHDGGWRIVIIDDADTMNRNAQNAILKILEEPPKKTLIILIAHRPGRLIPTIHSRTQKIAFNPLPRETVSQLVNKSDQISLMSDQSIDQSISMAKGSVGDALAILDDGGVEYIQILAKLLQDYPKIDWSAIHKQADSLSKKGQDASYKLFTDMAIKAFEDLLSHKAKNHPLPDYLSNHVGFQAISDNNSLDKLLSLYDNLKDHFSKVSFANLDKKQGILHAFHVISN